MNKTQIGTAIGSLALAVIAGLGISAAINAARTPEPVAVVQSVEVRQFAADPIHTPVAEPVVVAPVVEAPAPVEEVYVEPEPEPYSNSGEAVPFIPSSDPNNANGGDYIDPGSYCTSGSASGFPPVCD